MVKLVVALLLIFGFSLDRCYGELDPELNALPLPIGSTQEPLLVSLGSTCEVTHHLRYLGLRTAAFPLDWVLSLNNAQLIRLLEEDFVYFNDEEFLSGYSTLLLNTRYCLVFPHEGNWEVPFYSESLQNFKSKSQRRIDRFRELGSYQGQVLFFRSACVCAENSNAIYTDAENLHISDEYSVELYQTLKNRFPDLNFKLIIMNCFNENEVRVALLRNRYFPKKNRGQAPASNCTAKLHPSVPIFL